MLGKVYLNKLLIFCLLTFHFLMFELAFFTVLSRSTLVLSFYEIFICHSLAILLYLFLLYLLIKHNTICLFLSLFFLIVSIAIISLFIIIYSFTLLETILFYCMVGGGLAFLMVYKFYQNKILQIIFACVTLGLFGFLLYSFLINYFFASKIIFLSSTVVSICTTILSFESFGENPFKGHSFPFKWYFKIIIVSLPLVLAGVLYFPEKSIEIKPKGEPELVFWTSAVELPRDNETLDLCVKYGITFAIVLRVQLLTDGGSQEAERIRNLVNKGIRYHIVIGGQGSDFYCSLDNADEFVNDFIYIRNWLINNSLYYNVDSILVDAESPSGYFEKYESNNYFSAGKYFMENLPSKNDISYAEEKMNNFIDLVHADDKDMGIIMNPIYLDEEDSDYDQADIQKTIYGLHLPWDYSVTMIYRTQRTASYYDVLLWGLKDYNYMSDYEIQYYKYSKEDRYLMPISEFYYKVSLEMTGTPVNVKHDKRFIFLGNFNKRNKDTSYIKNKEYLKDLDIVKSFGDVDKVFFYEWSSFKSRYGIEELAKLGRHNQDNNKWVLTIPCFALHRELAYVLIVVLCDRYMFLEQSL